MAFVSFLTLAPYPVQCCRITTQTTLWNSLTGTPQGRRELISRGLIVPVRIGCKNLQGSSGTDGSFSLKRAPVYQSLTYGILQRMSSRHYSYSLMQEKNFLEASRIGKGWFWPYTSDEKWLLVPLLQAPCIYIQLFILILKKRGKKTNIYKKISASVSLKLIQICQFGWSFKNLHESFVTHKKTLLLDRHNPEH